MLSNDLVCALRNLRKNRVISSINVLGLSIGITSCLLVFLIVNYETSFDKFYGDRDRVYRIYSLFSGQFGGPNQGVPTAFADKVRHEFTGVDYVADFQVWSAKVEVTNALKGVVTFERIKHIVIANSDYFNVFNYYQWLVGEPSTSLLAPGQVVLTECQAKMYFGDVPLASMIGKEVVYGDSLTLSVSGIVKDIVQRTDLDFTDFISDGTLEHTWLGEKFRPNDWSSTNSNSQLFLKVSSGISRKKIEDQLRLLALAYKLNNKAADWTNTPQLQQLSEIHFNTDVGIFTGSRSVMKRSTLTVVGVIAVMLLVIAAINFVNLETALASRRAKEVGVRKVLGSSRIRLIRQFLMESFALTFMAIALSLLLAIVVIQGFPEFFPPGLPVDLNDLWVIGFLIICLFTVGILAGAYPAFVLSATHPVIALKNLFSQTRSTARSAVIRKGLTIFQFSMSQVMIVATLVIGFQIRYMLNKDLGFNTDHIVSVHTPRWQNSDKRIALKTELEQIPEIEIISLQNTPPGSAGYQSREFSFESEKEIVKQNVYVKIGDTAYLSLYDIKLIAGRNLQPADTVKEFLINETYMHQLGFTDPKDIIGRFINHKPVVGVVGNFHSRSMHNAIDPMIIMHDKRSESDIGMKISIGKNGVTDLQPTLAKIENAWKKIYGDENFKYEFLDDSVRAFYETELRTSKLAGAATFIAVLISCLGLFALSAFTVNQRTKEIGIRKVLGATVRNIVLLLTREFLALVAIAFLCSVPVAYYIADTWLKDFVYRIDLSVWIFLLCGMSSLLVALTVISFRTLRAANEDPVKALRYE